MVGTEPDTRCLETASSCWTSSSGTSGPPFSGGVATGWDVEANGWDLGREALEIACATVVVVLVVMVVAVVVVV